MRAFLCNLANGQTDRQTNAGKRTYLLLLEVITESLDKCVGLQLQREYVFITVYPAALAS